MNLTQLESRYAPAVDLGSGLLSWGQYQFAPFADWHGGLNCAESGNVVLVAPQSGGGPRVAMFDRNTGERIQGDYFAGPSSDRSGVVFVQSPAPPPTLVQVPHLSVGSGFPVYLNYSRPLSSQFVADSFSVVRRITLPLGMRLTTDRPPGDPGTYGTVVIGDDTSWYNGAGGYALPGRWLGQHSVQDDRAIYVGITTDADLAGREIAHEIGHAVGMSHNPSAASVMHSDSSGVAYDLQDLAGAVAPSAVGI